jgi:thymidylate synthase
MREYIAFGGSLPSAYHRALRMLQEGGICITCPDYGTNTIECGMTIRVGNPLLEPRISRCFPGGFRELEQYRMELLDGILDFEVERGNWAYTYHSRIAPQLPFVRSELWRNPYSRRAVIDIRDNEHDTQSAAPACLQHIQFFIRGGCLDMSVLFRSNDAVKAAFMNMFALTCLQQRVAKELGVEVGTYTHRVNSFHAYEKDWPLLRSYCERLRSGGDTTYCYAGEWDELMGEARADILRDVERLKG